MSNAERIPIIAPDENQENITTKPLAKVIDIKEQRPLSPEEIKLRVTELKENHPTWEVFFDKDGNPVGLPAGVTRKDTLFFLGNDGKWYAQNPSAELIEEIKMWRSDW